MSRWTSRMPFAGQPQEMRFFLLIFGWAATLGLIYWFATREAAGTVLLGGLALATGALSIWLRRSNARTGRRGDRATASQVALDAPDASGGGTWGVDRPFLDEAGRIPRASLGPFALGLGIALVALGPVFGLAPVAVGAVAVLWGASAWLAAARAEFDATDEPHVGSRREGSPSAD